jgi:glyoxylase-like metal-dependent hydrolase (beta-lactamase superfamily II)
MRRAVKPLILLACLLFCVPASAQDVRLQESPSPVNARYVEPSATRKLQPGQKIGELVTRNLTQPYVLQRLTDRTYWVQRQFYATIFYVGDRGVLLFDPLQYRGEQLLKAVREVTNLPVTAIVYTHDHADHIGDAKVFVDEAAKSGRRLRIIASRATADKMSYLRSGHPRPTEIVSWPRGSFTFEGLRVELHGFERAAHTDDHSAWLLTGERVLHSPDLLNPDQLPFLHWAGSDNFAYLEANLREADALDWNIFSGGHGNVGAKEDFAFTLQFIDDIKRATTEASAKVQWGDYLNTRNGNNHAAYTGAYTEEVVKRATDRLRSKYGLYYGFESSVPGNVEMVMHALASYQ